MAYEEAGVSRRNFLGLTLAASAAAAACGTVFTERLASPKLADTLASDLDTETAVLDPIEGLSDDDADDDYLDLMRENLAALQRAGGCP